MYFKESKLPTPVAELSYVQEEDESTEDKLRRLEDTGCGEEEEAQRPAIKCSPSKSFLIQDGNLR